MSDQTWVISTADLQIGTVLGFDLIDSNGNVLHAAGKPVNSQLKSFLQDNGIATVTIKGVSEPILSQAESILTSSFDPSVVLELNESLTATQQSVVKAIERLQQNHRFDSEEITRGVGYFVDTAGKDLAAALATLAISRADRNAQDLERLASRSARLALLGIVTSLSQGQTLSFTTDVGIAGLLHDCSLVRYPRLLTYNGQDALAEEDLAAYRRHPTESAEMLSRSSNLSSRVLQTIAQVHEQADGSGFPQGLRLSETTPTAVVLNIADAYLSLTDTSSSRRIVQSDAIAYLVNHAARGRFCPKTIQSMMRGMSIYPVGTIVLLDDQTKAVVVRSNTESPMKPVVRVLNSSQQRIDLLHSSRSISGPYVDGTTGYQRVRKGDINQIFWRLDALNKG